MKDFKIVAGKDSDFTVAPTDIKVASLTQDDALALADRSAEAHVRAVREHRCAINGGRSPGAEKLPLSEC